MEQLSFGEQVKIVLSRKGMTIKELAECIEKQTGRKMSRQNLTQRLGRDNFQEQDMRMIASILECPFTLDILTGVERRKTPASRLPVPPEETGSQSAQTGLPSAEEERDLTIGDLYNIHEELNKMEEGARTGEIPISVIQQELADDEILQEEFEEDLDEYDSGFSPVLRRADEKEDRELGEINPYTGREYQTNSVRMHPQRIGYVQVYDRSNHKWTDMTEWAFLGYQERKKSLLGKDYEPPIYLD